MPCDSTYILFETIFIVLALVATTLFVLGSRTQAMEVHHG